MRWAAIDGVWAFEGASATFLQPGGNGAAEYGIALSGANLRSGSVRAAVTLEALDEANAGKILLGYEPSGPRYVSVGIGGGGHAYTLSEYEPSVGWLWRVSRGHVRNLEAGRTYETLCEVRGQRICLTVDGVRVIEHNLTRPLPGDQLGLFAWGRSKAEFAGVAACIQRPRAFIVMQFTEPYNFLYSEVIHPVAEEMGVEAYRMDDVYRPGIILQDIIQGIAESEVVIAEITPPNENVFYELGYAHAMSKPTIILAERNKQLPFDVSSYRCIFYDNTIEGKTRVEQALREHLTSILNGR